jgi:adenylate kinase
LENSGEFRKRSIDMKLVLLGAPGSGKGTQAVYISEKYSIPAISTGEILRTAIRNETDIGLKAKEYVEAGKLVPDEIILGIISDRISQEDCKNGFILDGFPRTVRQAEALEEAAPVDCALALEVPDSVIVKRMTGRRVCKNCGRTYNVHGMPSKHEGICDACGAELITRSDDDPETVRERLKVYHRESEPLKGFFESRGKLRTVVADHDRAELTAALIFEVLGAIV